MGQQMPNRRAWFVWSRCLAKNITDGALMERELIAYALIGTMVLVGITWGGIAWRKRQRRKLRLRGIKHYGH